MSRLRIGRLDILQRDHKEKVAVLENAGLNWEPTLGAFHVVTESGAKVTVAFDEVQKLTLAELEKKIADFEASLPPSEIRRTTKLNCTAAGED
jgi:hypothetical protein